MLRRSPMRAQLFNETYLEREEDSVIRLRTLEDEAEEAQTVAALKAVYRCVWKPCTRRSFLAIRRAAAAHLSLLHDVPGQ